VQTSFKHHYVPIWYQKRFLAPGTTAFKILDMQPDRFPLPKGGYRTARNIIERGPGSFFFEKNLYTTRVFGVANDDIERMLFGTIDHRGAAAMEAYQAEDWNRVHGSYMHMFEFMDALRLRTPKGLAWLQQLAGAKSKIEVLRLMQELRTMHCVMWVEGVLEIVSAKNSDAKFIFSDHPVTLFNRHVFPVNVAGQPAGDPNIAFKGTQTIFPFDRDHLFVLTHIEGARVLQKGAAMSARTNARFFDNSLARYDKCVRNRYLTDAQVREVNYIMKLRAQRYIAGAAEDDLYPERHLKNRMWPKLGRFLLPESDNTPSGRGEIFMQTKDGVFHHQDAFGRRPTTKEEYEAKAKQAQAMHARILEVLAKDRDSRLK